MHRSTTRFPLALPALIGALLALSFAGSAAAKSSVFDTPSPMNLVFTEGSARLVGSEALIQVRCEGPQSGICNGTVALKVAGEDHKVPFAVTGGTRSSLAVPLGSADALRGKRAVALAKTVQQSGGYLRAREVLRLR
ncbi:MAG TPA: hypothetical protein VF030_09410 [Solirubrobacterales bacterium]